MQGDVMSAGNENRLLCAGYLQRQASCCPLSPAPLPCSLLPCPAPLPIPPFSRSLDALSQDTPHASTPVDRLRTSGKSECFSWHTHASKDDASHGTHVRQGSLIAFKWHSNYFVLTKVHGIMWLLPLSPAVLVACWQLY